MCHVMSPIPQCLCFSTLLTTAVFPVKPKVYLHYSSLLAISQTSLLEVWLFITEDKIQSLPTSARNL